MQQVQGSLLLERKEAIMNNEMNNYVYHYWNEYIYHYWNEYVYHYWADNKAIKFVTSKHGLNNNITITHELSFHH